MSLSQRILFLQDMFQMTAIVHVPVINIDLMSLSQRILFLQDMFQMTAIVHVPVINHYHINELHLF